MADSHAVPGSKPAALKGGKVHYLEQHRAERVTYRCIIRGIYGRYPFYDEPYSILPSEPVNSSLYDFHPPMRLPTKNLEMVKQFSESECSREIFLLFIPPLGPQGKYIHLSISFYTVLGTCQRFMSSIEYKKIIYSNSIPVILFGIREKKPSTSGKG